MTIAFYSPTHTHGVQYYFSYCNHRINLNDNTCFTLLHFVGVKFT